MMWGRKMQTEGQNWKAAALRAHGDYSSMLAVCGSISSSNRAAADQIEAAKAAKRALTSALKVRSPMRDEVAGIRFRKLINLL